MYFNGLGSRGRHKIRLDLREITDFKGLGVYSTSGDRPSLRTSCPQEVQAPRREGQAERKGRPAVVPAAATAAPSMFVLPLIYLLVSV